MIAGVDLLDEAARLGAAGAAAALATVLRTAGSTPRHAAAKMIVAPDGRLAGTIGGGRIEHEVIEAARAVANGGAAVRIARSLDGDLDMCCGGTMEIFVEPLDQARAAPIAEAARRRAQRRACVLVTDLGGAGKDVREADAERRPRIDGDRFIEPILPVPRLVLFGAGHVAHALAPLAAATGFEVVVCDPEERWLNPERFPAARLVRSFDPAAVAVELAPFGPGDHVVVVTRDHAVDRVVLDAFLGRELAFLGLVGSRAKVARIRGGVAATDEVWARVHAPVGLDIGAETPAEIAVSILAQLVATRAGKTP
jgi:xanthine dehydrogenase accessory factor